MVGEGVGKELAIGEADRRLPAAFRRVCGKVYLRPVGVLIAPEGPVPGPVESIESSEAGLQPRLKGTFGNWIVSFERKARLVIELPSDHSRVAAVVLCQRLHDSRAGLEIVWTVSVVEIGRAVSVQTVSITDQHIGMTPIQARSYRCR